MPSPEELREFVREHLSYEVEMLRETTKKLTADALHDAEVRERDLAWRDLPTRNALLECHVTSACRTVALRLG